MPHRPAAGRPFCLHSGRRLLAAIAMTLACDASDQNDAPGGRWEGLIEEIGRLTIVHNAGGGAW